MISLAIYVFTLSLDVKFRQGCAFFGLHQFGLVRFQMVMSHKMQHSMYYQKGQLMFKGNALLFRLTLCLGVGHDYLAQW